MEKQVNIRDEGKKLEKKMMYKEERKEGYYIFNQ